MQDLMAIKFSTSSAKYNSHSSNKTNARYTADFLVYQQCQLQQSLYIFKHNWCTTWLQCRLFGTISAKYNFLCIHLSNKTNARPDGTADFPVSTMIYHIYIYIYIYDTIVYISNISDARLVGNVDFPVSATPVTMVFVYISNISDAGSDGNVDLPVQVTPITISHCIFLKHNSIKTWW